MGRFLLLTVLLAGLAALALARIKLDPDLLKLFPEAGIALGAMKAYDENFAAYERMGVRAKPAESNASRIAATRPSIMSLGAITSQPASARETAVSASNGNAASLSTEPSGARGPQCP